MRHSEHGGHSFTDVKEYGIFQRNVLINKIEQGMLQKHSDFERLVNLSQKIKLSSNLSRNGNDIDKMLIELKESVQKINYSDLAIQIEMALSQTEMAENFAKHKQSKGFYNQSMPLMYGDFSKPVPNLEFQQVLGNSSLQCKPHHDYVKILQVDSEEECANNFEPTKTNQSINNTNKSILQKEYSNKLGQDAHENGNQKTSQEVSSRYSLRSTTKQTLNSIQTEENVNNVLSLITQVPVGQEEQELPTQKVEEGFKISDLINEERLEDEHKDQSKAIDQKKAEIKKKKKAEEKIFKAYLEKLANAEKKHDIKITPFFKDRSQFFQRFKNKGLKVYEKLHQQDKTLIQDLYIALHTYKRVSTLLQVPLFLVGKAITSNRIELQENY